MDKQPPIEIRNEDKRILLEEEIRKSFLSDGMEIDVDDIEIRDIIGEGAFGFVNRFVLKTSAHYLSHYLFPKF